MPVQSTHVEVPAEIQSPRGKLVYLYLATGGPSTISELQAGLAMTKLALYSVLGTLSERGVVEEVGSEYTVSSCFAGSGPF